MDEKESAGQVTGHKGENVRGSSADFAAPLGSATVGRLIFASGAAGLTLSGDPELAELYHAHFEGEIPGLDVHDGIVTVQYGHSSALDWLLGWKRSSASVALNTSISWEIEFRGGVSKLSADLHSLQLRSLDLTSASQVEIVLPRPVGVCYVHIAGSASDVVIRRPTDVAVRFQLNGSATRLALDEQYFGAIGDGVRLQSTGYGETVDRCEISVSGSVSKFAVGD